MSDSMAKYVIGAQNGDIDAFAKLYSHSLKSSYFLALKLCADENSAISVVKSAYAQAFCTLDKLKKPEAFDIWIKHTVANAYKHTQSFVFGDADGSAPPQQPEFLPESVFEDEKLSACIEQAVSALPAEQRAAIVLYYNNGMPVAALARYLGVSESTAGALLVKAKLRLSAALGNPEGNHSQESLPVLTRIFRRSAQAVVIANDTVRDIFIFASDEYEKFVGNSISDEPPMPLDCNSQKQEEPAASEESAELPQEESAPVTQNAPEETSPLSAPEADNEDVQVDKESEAEESKVESLLPEMPLPEAPLPQPAESVETEESFINREPATVADALIGSIVGDSGATIGDDALEQVKNSLSITDNVVEEPQGISFADYQGIASLAVDPAQEEEPSVKRSKSSSAKTIVVSAAAVIIVAAIVLVAYMLTKKTLSDADTTTAPTTTASVVANEKEELKYQWVSGGYEEYTELEYFNEYAFTFKDKESGKYGLMSYDGETVLLKPNYYNFQRCTYGKTYTNADNYHYLLTLEESEGSDKYEITFNVDSQGKVTGVDVNTDEPHNTNHLKTNEVLDNKLYDERDREHSGFTAVCKNGKWGYINESTGELALEYEYEKVNNASDMAGDYCLAVVDGVTGYVAVKKGGLMGVVNVFSKEIIVPFEYEMIMQGYSVSDGGAVFVAYKGSQWGVLKVGTAIAKEPEPDETTEPSGVKSISGSYTVLQDANIRSDAGGEFDLIGEYEAGTMIEAKYSKQADNGNEWIGFEYNGGYGWISSKYLEETGA